jgi:hypothetical protein
MMLDSPGFPGSEQVHPVVFVDLELRQVLECCQTVSRVVIHLLNKNIQSAGW